IVGRGPDLGRGLAAPARRAALRTGSAGLSMSGRLFRTLTPLGWLATVAAVALLLLVVGRGAGLRWDPLQLQACRLETAQRRADRAEVERAARALEAEARGRQLDHLDAF